MGASATKPSRHLSQHSLRSIDWTGRRVTIMGLGRHGGGLGAARFLARQGAIVTISDSAPRESLLAPISVLECFPIERMAFGGHDPADLLTAEFVVVNPAVRPDHPLLAAARGRGARLISEIELALAYVPARTIGVTGTCGKSTTAAMLAEILTSNGHLAWLGGNFGGSLLDHLDQMNPSDWAVIELSSFQLEHLSDAAQMPRLVVVTHCRPHHLEWHGSTAAYLRAKQRIVTRQPPTAVAVLDAGDPTLADWPRLTRCEVRAPWSRTSVRSLLVPGEHNRANAALAAAAAEVAGVPRTMIVSALARFSGLPHRLQLVHRTHGRRFYNDSKATSPSATAAALAAVPGRVWLLAGGALSNADHRELAANIVSRASGVALFGAARCALADAVRSFSADFPLHLGRRLDAALQWCWRQSNSGDAILLSPGCASHDQYDDFAARGREFCEMVMQLTPTRQ